MKLKPYPKYKPSGVEWLGDVPEHWKVMRSRFVIAVNPPSPVMKDLNPDAEVSFIPMDAVGVDGGLKLDQSRVLSDVSGGYTAFQDGDVVVAKITPCFENGKAALARSLVNGAAYGTTELHVLRTVPGMNNSFLFYTVISDNYRKLGESEMYGAGGQKRVPPEFVKDYRASLPSLDEQRSIAAFLDRETGRIDRLVAKKRELIERLKERRTALISRTVTRGLPPAAARAAGFPVNPPLKPSGIDWLGNVAEHWRVSRIKFLVSTPVTDGPHETPEIFDEGVPFVSAEAISNGVINFARIRGHITAEDHSRFSRKYKPRRGDIYLIKSGATTGRVAIVETDIEFNIWSPLAAIRSNAKLVNRYFLFYFMQSKEFRTAIELSWSFGTQQNIGMGVIENLEVPVPPLQEQAAIASYLDTEIAKLDALIAKVEEAIERLQEYRTAMITAAVTGKVDVRESVLPASILEGTHK